MSQKLCLTMLESNDLKRTFDRGLGMDAVEMIYNIQVRKVQLFPGMPWSLRFGELLRIPHSSLTDSGQVVCLRRRPSLCPSEI